jgi:RHS repeat-associated protein
MLYANNGRVDGGLYLTRFRADDPRIGRWLSRDPVGESAGPNLYWYVDGDPLNLIDPLGREGDQKGKSCTASPPTPKPKPPPPWPGAHPFFPRRFP